MTIKLRNKFIKLENELNGEVLERHQEIHTAVLALLSRKHHFQLGPPGIAKSLLVERMYKRIGGLNEGDYFRLLMTRTTLPEEVFGAADLGIMKSESKFVRDTTLMLPQAYLAFLDEIFKSNSSILNALLTIANERRFDNGGKTYDCPLNTLFGASNELPAGDELGALWDRLHFRHEVQPISQSSNFVDMIRGEFTEPNPVITLDDISTAQEQIAKVELEDSIISHLLTIKSDLMIEGIQVTDRRWNESIDILQAEAWMNGNTTIQTNDLKPLRHILWEDTAHSKIVAGVVYNIADPIEKAANELMDELHALVMEFKSNMQGVDNEKVESDILIENHSALKKAKIQIEALEEKVADADATTSALRTIELVKMKAKEHATTIKNMMDL